MRIVVLILGILGGLTSGYLGYRWLSDYDSRKGDIERMRKESASGKDAELDAKLAQVDKAHKASYCLLAGCLLGIAGGVLGYMGKGLIGAALMLVGFAVPAIFAPLSLVFSCPLILGCVLSLLVKAPHPAYSHAAA